MSRNDAPSDKPLSRKQREIRQRHGLILDTARDLLAADGLAGLSMDRIAERIEYSKGTVYQHFACKEDLILHLSLRGLATWRRLYDRALAFAGLSRERLFAIHLAHSLAARLDPVEYECIYLSRTAGIREKVPAEGQQAQSRQIRSLFGDVVGVIEGGVGDGSLPLGRTLTAPQLVYSFWALQYGQILLESYSLPYEELGIHDQRRVLRRTLHAILDGYGWRPLYAEHDYVGLERRLLQEVFEDEARQVAAADAAKEVPADGRRHAKGSRSRGARRPTKRA